MKYWLLPALALLLTATTVQAAPMNYTVNASENLTVTGTPRIELTIGATTRYATYASGSGTTTLTFSYTPVLGDFDADGVTAAATIDLNGGTLKDTGGTDLPLAYTLAATPLVRVQAYTPTLTTTPVNDANKTAVAFSIAGAPISSTYNYSFTSSGGGTSVTGTGAVSADPQAVTGINVSSLPSGTLTLSLTITAASGTGNAKTTSTTYTNSFTGMLDSLPATQSAFALRRLATAYTGPLVRVRRSSDNAEQNISYTGSGDLDTTALSTFCAATTCFVRTFYDQSGNSADATMAATSLQPSIFSGGVVNTLNARPTILFAGGGQYLRQADDAMGSMGSLTIITAFQTLSNKTMQLFDIRQFGDGNPVFDDGNLDGFGARRRDDSATLVSASTFTYNTTPHVHSISYDGPISTIFHWLDGGTANTASSSGVTAGNFFITLANNGFSPLASNYNGQISEFVMFPSALSLTNRQAAEANMKSYYGTP